MLSLLASKSLSTCNAQCTLLYGHLLHAHMLTQCSDAAMQLNTQLRTHTSHVGLAYFLALMLCTKAHSPAQMQKDAEKGSSRCGCLKNELKRPTP